MHSVIRHYQSMEIRKPQTSVLLVITVALSFAITLGGFPHVLIASSPLPKVSPKIEKPQFWIKKIKNPTRLLLTPEEIRKMNEENLKKLDLLLCKVKDMKEEWSKEEILSLLKEDWEGFENTGEVRYGRNGYPLEESFLSELKKDLNQESLVETTRILFGLTVKRTDIRVFPTHEISMNAPGNYEFDRFQHSGLPPGSLVGIYHFTKDRLWAYLQTPFIRGWVHTTDLAIAKEKREAVDYEEAKDRLVVTGNFVKVFSDPSFQQTVFVAQMGTTFPILGLHPYYVIKIPFCESDGRLTFREGYIRRKEDVHLGFLPYTQGNMAHQAFKMLHQPYGWGEMFGARDCSRFIMDLFSSFGILMPRNSRLQAMVGIDMGQVEGMSLKEKQRVLDRAIPLATTLRLPGHIMLYLGKDHGKYYVIHNIWGIQGARRSGPVFRKIGQVVVSDLSLGSSGPNGSLLDRIVDIRFIGLGPEGQRNFLKNVSPIELQDSHSP